MADVWDSALYDDRHSFVWKKAGDLIDLLDPGPGERILDLGCGTGHLTAQIAGRSAEALGLDSSISMVAQARLNYPKVKFMLADIRDFECDQPFDAVFSNATLHWIPEPAPAIAAVRRALKPKGRFVLEMGAKNNIARIVAALSAVLQEHGYALHNPWYFPSAAEYASLLERNGFDIAALWTFARWNKLEHPERGLREWLEMFAGAWMQDVPAGAAPGIVSELEARLRPALCCDGAWWADYHRLRIIAIAV